MGRGVTELECFLAAARHRATGFGAAVVSELYGATRSGTLATGRRIGGGFISRGGAGQSFIVQHLGITLKLSSSGPQGLPAPS